MQRVKTALPRPRSVSKISCRSNDRVVINIDIVTKEIDSNIRVGNF